MASTCPRAESRYDAVQLHALQRVDEAAVRNRHRALDTGAREGASNRQIEIGSSCHALPGHREHGVGDGKVGASREILSAISSVGSIGTLPEI